MIGTWGQPFQPRGLKTPMAGKNHIIAVDEHRIEKAELLYARRDPLDLLSGMCSRVSRAGPKRANRDPFDAGRARRVGTIVCYNRNRTRHCRLRDWVMTTVDHGGASKYKTLIGLVSTVAERDGLGSCTPHAHPAAIKLC
jgi:hypothetical protein